jgi:hypothetical protein
MADRQFRKRLENEDPKEELSHILSEENFLLIGATAYLGFQFTVIYSSDFLELTTFIQYAHFISLYLIGLSVALLFAPIARHRIGHKGEHSVELSIYAHYIFKIAMALFSLGVSTEVYSVLYIMSHSQVLAIVVSSITLMFFAVFWFGIPLLTARSLTADGRDDAL